MPETSKKTLAALCWLGSLLGVLLMSWLAISRAQPQMQGHNDFLALYSAPHLIGGDLYDGAALLRKEVELTGLYSESLGFIRPPFVAALMWPLSRLPYGTAVRVWQAVSLAALAAFVLTWSPTGRPFTALAVSMSIPALLAWLNGQDTPFVLLAAATAVRLHLAGKPWLAGLVFSLCAAKGHLFLLTPVWILARKDWDFLRGLLTGGLALGALSTLAAGWTWPLEMWRAVQNPAFSPNPHLMTNLHGAFLDFRGGWAIEAALSLSVAAAVWILARHSAFLPSFAGLLLGGVLLARHSYSADLLIVLPGCLAAIVFSKTAALRLTSMALLAPPLALAIQLGRPYSLVYTLALWALLVGWAFETHQAARTEMDGAPA